MAGKGKLEIKPKTAWKQQNLPKHVEFDSFDSLDNQKHTPEKEFKDKPDVTKITENLEAKV